MDRAEAIQELANLAWVQGGANRGEAIEALNLAIKALEREIEYGQMVVDFTKGETMTPDEWKYDTTKLAPSVTQTERTGEWIPFTKRPLTDEEKQEYPDWAYIFDCPLPDDGEEILLSNGKHI